MCKNHLYSSDSTWYDPAIYNAITALDEKYDNAIPVFGGALGAYNNISSDNPDYMAFIKSMFSAAKNAVFHDWHEGAVGAMRRFCHICLIDPSLIELYMGMTLAEAAEAIGV